ncbi:MAG: hypothetical protein FWF03_08365, partial [Defluviitaleaceae bacterium]|nr:hypothetical protein [Defluviitaleaceae bacterium]
AEIAFEKNEAERRADPAPVAAKAFEDFFLEIDADYFYLANISRMSEFEGLRHFENFVDQKTTGKTISHEFVSADGTDRRRYAVCADGEVFAEFSLYKSAAGSGASVWEFERAGMFIDRYLEPFDVLVPEGCAVYLNGILVTGGYASGNETPSAYEGAHTRYRIQGLLFEPEINAVLPDGAEARLYYDAQSNAYRQRDKAATAQVLSGSRLFINGAEAGDELIVSERIATGETERLGIYYRLYRVSGSFGEISMTVVDGFGKETALDGEDDVFLQPIEYDAKLENEYGAFAIEAAKTYAAYMTNDSSMSEINRYFARGTPTYDGIRTSEVIWYTKHEGYRFENARASSFYRHDEETFSCRITMDHYVVRTQADTRHFPLDFTLFIKDYGGTALVSGLSGNN